MSTEVKKEIALEIAHVLFIDIVGYSKLSVNQQHAAVDELNGIVRASEQFQKAEAANRILKIPTGDGMALVFYRSPEEPAQCAFEISRALKDNQRLQVRMGIHSGPISGVVDVNERTNVAGAGINLAQRVMDCGDAGHILLSRHVAEDLAEYERWRPYLHDIGTFEVKHGVRVSVTNLYSDEVGNPNLPSKLQAVKKHHAHVRWAAVAIGLLVVAALAAGVLSFLRKGPARSLATAVEKSIAVLPFENLSRDPDNAYFADGVQDEILTNLAKIADLKVISRTSVMQYKTGAARNLREIGKALGVSHLLEGSVQRAANRVRVNAQLINANTDAHLWAETYDRDLADVFVIQSEIAKTIASQLRAKLSPAEKAEIAQKPTSDLAAFDLYTRAKVLREAALNGVNAKEDLLQVVNLLTQAIERDPAFLLAYCQLGRAHDTLYVLFDHAPARLALGQAAVDAAVRLAPDSGDTHLAAAFHLYAELDYDRAREELAVARRTLPNNAGTFELNGYINRRQNRWAEAAHDLEQALELDPRNPSTLGQLGTIYDTLRDYPAAAGAWDRILAFRPDDFDARIARAELEAYWRADTKPLHALIEARLKQDPAAGKQLAETWLELTLWERDLVGIEQALAALGDKTWGPNATRFSRTFGEGLLARMKGDAAAAHAAFSADRIAQERIVQAEPEYGPAISVLGLIDAGLGRKEDALREGRRGVELLPLSKDAINGPSMIRNLAIIGAWTGEKDLALEQLRIATQGGNGPSYGALKLNPMLDPLRGDPRFEKIVASLAPK